MSANGASSVTIVGHSLGKAPTPLAPFQTYFEVMIHLGGAIALITSVYLPLHLAAGTAFKTVTYGMPRVGLLHRSRFMFPKLIP